MKNINIGIIGCGHMGGAIARGISNKKISGSGVIMLNDQDEAAAGILAKETGGVVQNLSEIAKNSEILIIAVKPQDSEVLLREMSANIAEQTVVSVMAGVMIRNICNSLGREVPVVRAMPNMGAFIGESMTAISHNSLVEDIGVVKSIFESVGKVVEVDESEIDAVTALSGSGPAYLFYLADAMADAGVRAGLEKEVSEELTLGTLLGAAKLLSSSKDSASELISKVASKGGTTEMALSIFEEKGLKAIIEEAILAAKKRSEELSKG